MLTERRLTDVQLSHLSRGAVCPRRLQKQVSGDQSSRLNPLYLYGVSKLAYEQLIDLHWDESPRCGRQLPRREDAHRLHRLIDYYSTNSDFPYSSIRLWQ